MDNTNRKKVINDPIYGFVNIPNDFIFEIIQHPYFQRLRRITQMGLSYLVYPGAKHTRFHHALGCLHLMQRAVQVLRFKKVTISEEEEEALYIAILLHDIGHGPFSHALEYSLAQGITHEELSLRFMEKLNEQFSGKLSLAIKIFNKEYHRPFINQLVSSQLDIDRLDYLSRDCFYSGVAEGNIGAERVISMLNVKDEKLIIDPKGLYSIENFIIARRLMYWLVYLHKTSLVAEHMLISVLKRAKHLMLNAGQNLPMSSALKHFISAEITKDNFSDETLLVFSRLDDYDIISGLKEWQFSEDFVLSRLSQMILDRELLKIKKLEQEASKEQIEDLVLKTMQKYHITPKEAEYFVSYISASHRAYHPNKENIFTLNSQEQLIDVSDASDLTNIKALSQNVTKHFLCYPKNL